MAPRWGRWMTVRRRGNKLERWETALIKAMVANGRWPNDQDILAHFTRPTRSINHKAIAEIRTGKKLDHRLNVLVACMVQARGDRLPPHEKNQNGQKVAKFRSVPSRTSGTASRSAIRRSVRSFPRPFAPTMGVRPDWKSMCGPGVCSSEPGKRPKLSTCIW